MAQMLFEMLSHYQQLMNSGDERVSRWPLMRGPLPTIAICLSYVVFVKRLGPWLMRDRAPLNMRWLMVAYNFAMVAQSTLIFALLGYYGWFGNYNLKCQPVDYSNSPSAVAMTHIAWWYYISKYIEFCDTLFFVLRKKNSQISTLHVIHHGVMPMSVWWGVKFTPGGHSTFFAFVNSAVHILMYTYYGIAAIGPHMNKYLTWKKYMTTIQMVQFIMIFAHSFQLLFRDCDYPRGFMWWIGFHAIMFWFLFWDFYKNTYRARRAQSSNGSATHVANGKTTFLACSPTESLINGMNKAKNHENGKLRHQTSNGTTSPYSNGHCNHLNGDHVSNGHAKEH